MKLQELTETLFWNDWLIKFELKKWIYWIIISRDIWDMIEVYVWKWDNFEEIYIYSVLKDLKIDDKEFKKRIDNMVLPWKTDEDIKNILLSYIR